MRLCARIFVLLLALLSFPGLAEIRVKVDSSQETVLEVRAAGLTQTEVTREGQPYSEVRLPGFGVATGEGVPEVPYQTVRLLVPDQGEFRIEVGESSVVQAIPLRHDVSFAEVVPVHDGLDRKASRDVVAYARQYGTSLVEVEEVGLAGNDKILALRVWPVRYDAPAKQLSLTSQFQIRVHYLTKNPARLSASNGVARYIVANSKRFRAPAPTRKVDLIIAHKSYEMDLFRLIEFKVTRGRTVRIRYVEGQTADQIKAIIKSEYDSAEPPTQTLLIGSLPQIPAFSGSSDNTWTDYNYQLLGTDSVPDISVGRIPASNSIELRNFVDKAIARELEPRNIENVLITSGQDTSMGCPANVTKVGANLKTAGPALNIIKRFRTEVSTEQVIAGYNDNPNLIVYDGHGNRDGMTEVPLTISTLNKLSNTAFPIVLDIACLNANWSSGANWRNFTASILFEERRGVAGIMASGGSGNGHEFFQSIGKIMADARKNLSNDTKMNEVGQAILAAKILHGQQDRAYWNYYGDPASSVWESTY